MKLLLFYLNARVVFMDTKIKIKIDGLRIIPVSVYYYYLWIQSNFYYLPPEEEIAVISKAIQVGDISKSLSILDS